MKNCHLHLFNAGLATVWMAASACLLTVLPPGLMPQAGSNEDFLSVLLGDAKADLSQAMIHEADSYFHGGVDMECHALHAHEHEDHGHGGHKHGDEHGVEVHEHGKDCPCGHCGHESEVHEEAGFDPWGWINARIRAPEIERHLEGNRTIEMMPWFWMAVKSDPHNVEAWSTAWYVASRMMKDDMLAFKIAEEGQRLNPKSIEMACVMGRTYRAKGTLDLAKSEVMFEESLKIGKEKEKMTDAETSSFCEALGYLSEYASRRKDRARLQRLLGEAKNLGLNHPVVQVIEARLLELQPQPK